MSENPARLRRRLRLQTVLLIVFLLLVSIPGTLLTVVPAIVQANLAIQDVARNAESTLVVHGTLLSNWYETTQRLIGQNLDGFQDEDFLDISSTILTSAPVSESVQATRTEWWAGTLEGFAEPIDRIVLVNTAGEVKASTDSALVNTSFSQEQWLEDALQNGTRGEVRTVGPLRDAVDMQESLYFSIPVFDSDTGQMIGVLCGRVTIDKLAGILTTIPRLGDTSEYYLVRAGQLYVVQPEGVEEDQVFAGDSIVPETLSGVSGSGTWTDYNDRVVVGAYQWVEPLRMSLVLKVDRAEVIRGAAEVIRIQLLVGGVAGVIVLGLAAFITFRLTRVIRRTMSLSNRIVQGDLDIRLPGSQLFEVDRIANAFNALADRLQLTLRRQQRIIATRTRELEITARMGHAIASETDFERLLQTTIELIRDQLGYYHAQVFLLDDLRRMAVLRASMGEAGREMLSRAHKLGVGSNSVVGQAATRGEPVLASDTEVAEFWTPNPLLPETRAELGIPISIGGQIMGVLDIQAREADVFDESTISVLRTVADQLAVAIRNSQLFDEKESLLSASLELTQMLTQDSWEDYVRRQKDTAGIGYEYDLSQVRPVQKGAEEGDLKLPISLRGAVIGEMVANLGDSRLLSDEEVQLAGQVLERMALAIDNARLVEQTQQSLAQTNRLYQATQQIAAANSESGLAEVMVHLGAVEGVDRAALLLLDNPDRKEGDHWVRVSGLWLRDENDPFGEIDRLIMLSQFPALGHTLNQFKTDPLVLNDVDQAAAIDNETRAGMIQEGTRAAAVFPIFSGLTEGDILGWFVLYSASQTGVFTDDDARFFETIAGQAANALEGIRLFEQTQRRARRLVAQNEVSRAASSILNQDILLPLVVDRVSEAFGYYHSQIFLIDENREWAVLRASTGEVGQELLRREHRLAVGSRSVIGQVTERGEIIIARDTDTDAVHRRNELLPDTRAEMAVPLKTGDRVIGALDVQSTEVDAFDEDAQAILQSLADQIAVTLENSQLFQEIQERIAELTTVTLISQSVSRATTLEDVYDVVADQLLRQFNAQYGFLGVLDESDMLGIPIFIEAGERQQSPPPQPVGEGLSGHVIRSKEVLMITEDAENRVRELGARVIGAMPNSVLAVPMLIGDEVVGVLSIQDNVDHAFTEAHVRQLTTLAAYIAVKIRNAELLEEAQRRAYEVSFLFNVTQTAVAAEELSTALENVADVLVREIPGAETAVIYLAEPGENTLEATAAVGYGRDMVARQTVLPFGEGIPGMAAENRQSMLANELEPDGRKTRSAVAVPLVSGPEVVGVMAVESSQANAFSEDSVRLLEGASSSLTAVVQSARLLEQVTRANEQLRELDTLKSQFLANMSHELRTPLNSIIGFSRVMLKGIDGELNDLQMQDLNTIYNGGQHLLGLINNILDVSKIEAGKMEIQSEYITLEDTVDSVLATGKGLVKDKPIQIFKEIEENLPQVYADPVRIRQVLLNLVSNASKFTQEGSITVRATRRSRDLETGELPRVQVDVIDTGIGIAPEDMGKLFEAFSQVDGSTTRQAGGTGLGLTITKQFVELMNGHIWVESEVNRGSTFSFTIPLHPPGAEITEVVIASEDVEGRPVVLAVDDEPGVLDLYMRYLEKEGYAVVGLNNANDLLGHVRNIVPSAIVLDLNLPGKTGWDAIDELKDASDTRNIPIVICSIDDDRDRGHRLGVDEYLVKPIIEEDLLDALSRVLQGRVSSIGDVILIDPDVEFAGMISGTLKEAYGSTVRVYSTGVDGLQGLQERRPDIVLLDLDLPDMDGYGLLVSIRSQPGTQTLPIIVMTARTLTEEQVERLGGETTHCIGKSMDDLSVLLQGMGK